jgi:hypothetical protein
VKLKTFPRYQAFDAIEGVLINAAIVEYKKTINNLFFILLP